MKTKMTSIPFSSAPLAVCRGKKSRTGSRHLPMAFTLIELLVVIAIIAILASMLMPVLNVAMTHAKETQAKLEVNQIYTAINQYESQYSRMPVSTTVQQSGYTNITYGGIYSSTAASGNNQWPSAGWSAWSGANPQSGGYETTAQRGLYITNNSEVISILMDFTNYPNTTTWTVNTNFQKNPMQTTFLSAKLTGDTSSPGIGSDLNYRDPWGNLYIITLDLNEDNAVEDPFYCVPAVSSANGSPGGNGLNGLNIQPDGNYAFHGNVMVWSMGPNGPYTHSPSSFTYSTSANPNNLGWALDPSNKHHILSWTQ
jgi:prepilin-type N-terminal cleavage/methylation domain-containing protein